MYYGIDAVQRFFPVIALTNVSPEHFVWLSAIVRIFGCFSAMDLRIEVVEPANPLTVRLESRCDATTDESRASRNEDFRGVRQRFSPMSIGLKWAVNRIQIATPHLFCLTEAETRDKDKVSHFALEKQVAITEVKGRAPNRLRHGVVIHDSFCLGDLVYLGAMLAALRDQVPSLPISVVVGGIGRVFPFFDSIGVRRIELPVPWDDSRWYKRPLRTLKGLPRAAIGLRSLARQSVLADPRGDLRHVAVATLAGRRTVSSLSFETWGRLWGRLGNHIFVARRNWLWQLQDHLGLPRTAPKWPWITVPPVPPKDPLAPPTVLLSPGVSGALRRWDPVKWQQLAKIMRRMGLHPVFIREPGRTPSVLDDEEEWSGSIEQLASRLASANLVVGVDSFVGHLAAAIGTPTLTLFGPQLPELWTPWGPHARYVIAEPFSCRPCTQRRCVRPGASCMDLLQMNVVANAVEDFFSTAAGVTSLSGSRSRANLDA